MKAKLDHVSVLVEKLDENVMNFYKETFGCESPKYFHVENSTEEMNYAYLPLPKGDSYFELHAPVRGPQLDYMKKKGQGCTYEICVEVDNIEEFYDNMKKKGITLCDGAGKPLPANKKYMSIPSDGNKYAYLPAEQTFGAIFEVLERNAWKRDTYWPPPSK